MRFILVHKTVSYLMVLTSTLSLLVSGELPPWMSGLFLLAVAGSWFWEPPRIRFERFQLTWNLLTILVLVTVVLQVFGDESLLGTGIQFILFLMLNKLYNRKTSRDYLQLYVLSFMELIAGSTVDVDITYGLQFILYIVFGTWTLILFHLKREMEDNFLLKYGDSLQGRPVQVERVLNSRKLVGPRFLLATSAVSLLVFLGSSLVFVLFPRIGFGLFFKKQRPGILMSGFSDRVELGHFGTVKDDPTVVMRVELPDLEPSAPVPAAAQGYWRGVSFDRYDGLRWTKSRPVRRRLQPSESDPNLFPIDPQASTADRLVQRIYLEPMETHVLFGLTRFEAVGLPDPGLAANLPGQSRALFRDADGDVLYAQTDDLAFRYTAYSLPDAPPPGLWHTNLAAYRTQLLASGAARRYLQLPEGLEPEVAHLAARVVGDATTLGQAVERVEAHLRTEYAYSLTLERDERRAPLEDFLFVQHKGHCEYFATALAVLLRTQGIATRNVNGFLGGTWNGYGNYLAVSQGEAHSWVEVWLPGGQWVTRDATPSGPERGADRSFLAGLLQYADALRLRWYKYVIEYDLGRQLGLAASLKDSLKGLFGDDEESERAQARAGGKSVLSGGLVWVAVAGGGLVLAGLVFWWWRPRRRMGAGLRVPGRPEAEAAASLYRALQAGYAQRGWPRPPQATAREYLRLLEQRQAPLLDVAARVVGLYEGVRFGGEPAPEAEVRALRQAVKGLRRTT